MSIDRATLCLCMIIRNEAHVLRRCLDSVRPLIDAWVVVDTGSADGTQEIAREALRGWPGDLIERIWVDFAHDRNQALDHARARADNIMLIDADEKLEVEPGFAVPPTSRTLRCRGSLWRHDPCPQAARALGLAVTVHRRGARVHHLSRGPDPSRPSGLRTLVTHDGALSRDPNTYRRDTLVLERALIDEPGNTRYVLYLAQSWRHAGEHELALRWYRRRARMGGWQDEVWHALYQIGRVQERTGTPWPETAASYLAA